MDTRYKMLKIQSRESCIREYRRIPKEWIQDTKCWRYKVQEHVSENTGGYLNKNKTKNWRYKVQDPISENTGGYLIWTNLKWNLKKRIPNNNKHYFNYVFLLEGLKK